MICEENDCSRWNTCPKMHSINCTWYKKKEKKCIYCNKKLNKYRIRTATICISCLGCKKEGVDKDG